jgi:hypothetical protein
MLLELAWEKRSETPAVLALQKPVPGIVMADLARQVHCIQRMREKVPAWHRPGLRYPSVLCTEQCSSEATARFKARLFGGAVMADLSGGLGVDACFFAEKYGHVHHVESNAELSAAVRHNMDLLDRPNVETHATTAADFLEKNTQPLDLIYLDPARRDAQKNRVFRLEDCQPDVLAMQDELLRHAPALLLKTAPMLDIKMALRQLRGVKKVWVLAVRDECKEVLYHIERGTETRPDTPVCAAWITSDGVEHLFEFDYASEELAVPSYALPGRYLYEPNAAVLKAGAFKSFALQYGLQKLHEHTHLYTSMERVAAVPGRVFEVLHTCKYDKKTLLSALPTPMAHVATRNFPDSSEQVRRKLGLRDGGDFYLFALTDMAARRVVCVCRKA